MSTTITVAFFKKDNTDCIYHSADGDCYCDLAFPMNESCDICNRVCKCVWNETNKENKEATGKLVLTKTLNKIDNKSLKKIKTTFRREWLVDSKHEIETTTTILTFSKFSKLTTFDIFRKKEAPKIHSTSIRIRMNEDGSGVRGYGKDPNFFHFSRDDSSMIEEIYWVQNMSFDKLSDKLEKDLEEAY